jgi:hypothetical protein
MGYRQSRHLFKADPNRVSNIIGLHDRVHSEVSGLWTAFRSANPNATAKQVMEFAMKIDNLYGRYYNTLSSDAAMPLFK